MAGLTKKQRYYRAYRSRNRDRIKRWQKRYYEDKKWLRLVLTYNWRFYNRDRHNVLRRRHYRKNPERRLAPKREHNRYYAIWWWYKKKLEEDPTNEKYKRRYDETLADLEAYREKRRIELGKTQ